MNRSVKVFLKVFLSVVLGCAVLATAVFAGALFGWIDFTGNLDIEDIQLDFTSFVVAIDSKTGKEVEFEKLYDEYNRVWVDYADIPQHVIDAAISIEDERFYSHKGFDVRSTAKAVYQYVFRHSTARGASTITQQLVKNLSGDAEKTPWRKAQEIVRAVNLEQKLSKEQVMELYLNTIYLSQGCSGLQTAADFYFGKDVAELTVAEGAALVGITQYPTQYDPILHPAQNKEKQEVILKKMLDLGKLTQTEYEKAMAQKLVFKANSTTKAGSKQSYFVDQVVAEVLQDLQDRRGYSKAVASKMLYTGGIKIYATVDVDVQKTMDKVYQDVSNFVKAPGEVQPESAMTIMDPNTGYVRGLVGGRGTKNASLTLNRATQSQRQPGSTIKPLAVYAPAIEADQISPNSVYTDKAIRYGTWAPKNYYDGFRGSMTVKYAVAQSTNTVAVQVLEDLGVDKSYDFMTKNLHITTLVDSDRSLASLGLGGLTHGMTNLELTAAYAAMANKGIYNKPVCYTKVLDHSGKVLLENKPRPQVAMSEKTAATMMGLLVGVVQNGTGAAANFSDRYSIAGKTGTTDGDKDRWFVGMTPYYVGAVWFGFDTPQEMRFIKVNPTVPIWKKIMAEIHQKANLPSKYFTLSSGSSDGGTNPRKSDEEEAPQTTGDPNATKEPGSEGGSTTGGGRATPTPGGMSEPKATPVGDIPSGLAY